MPDVGIRCIMWL